MLFDSTCHCDCTKRACIDVRYIRIIFKKKMNNRCTPSPARSHASVFITIHSCICHSIGCALPSMYSGKRSIQKYMSISIYFKLLLIIVVLRNWFMQVACHSIGFLYVNGVPHIGCEWKLGWIGENWIFFLVLLNSSRNRNPTSFPCVFETFMQIAVRKSGGWSGAPCENVI